MPDPNKTVVVIGYPKSGNTWSARLIADMLDSPVSRFKNALPLATEGQGRKGGYFVTQLHMRPIYDDECNDVLKSASEFNLSKISGERAVIMFRDPFDVVVSVKEYWRIKSIQDTINVMAHGKWPLLSIGAYPAFIRSWMTQLKAGSDDKGQIMAVLRYEDLHRSAAEALKILFGELGLPFHLDRIDNVVERQSFDKKKDEISRDGGGRPHGRSVQLRNLRKGIVGDWVNHFSSDDLSIAEKYLGDIRREMGYD